MNGDDLECIAAFIYDQLIAIAIDTDHARHAHTQAGLFEHFARAGLLKRLARLQSSARHAPHAVIAATRQQYALCIVEDRGRTSNADLALAADARSVTDL